MAYLLNFILISVVTAFTPGPNNSIAMRSGMLFGWRASLGHVMGVVVGFNILFQSLYFGLSAVLQSFPWLLVLLKIFGSLYLVYLAYQMLRLKPTSSARSGRMRFYESVLFQWINVKAWFFILSLMAILPEKNGWESGYLEHFIISGILALLSFSSALCWTLLGVSLNRILNNNKWAGLIGVLLALSLVYVAVSWWLKD